jgi:hypothetical protein
MLTRWLPPMSDTLTPNQSAKDDSNQQSMSHLPGKFKLNAPKGGSTQVPQLTRYVWDGVPVQTLRSLYHSTVMA